MRQTTGLYTVLEVAPDSDPIVIEAAYRALMKKYHPDRLPGDAERAERKAKQLNAAYAILRDPDSRRQHDEALRASPDPAMSWDWRYTPYPAGAAAAGWQQSAPSLPHYTDRGIVRQGIKMLVGTVGILVTGVWLILSEGNATPALSALVFAPADARPDAPAPSLSGHPMRLRAIPAQLRGTWAFDAGKCVPEAPERAHVAADRIDFWISSGRVDSVVYTGGDGAFEVELSMAGEGRVWDAHFELRVSPDGSRLRVSDESGFDNSYVRCPASPGRT
jgi:hypothetical protein